MLCRLLLLYSVTTIHIIAVNRFWACISTGEKINGVKNGRDCRALTGSCPFPSNTKGTLSPCLVCTTGLGPATQPASSSSKSSPSRHQLHLWGLSKLEAALRGTGRKPEDGAELGPADVLCLRPTSGWECSALGRASRVRLSCQRLRGVLNRSALQVQV